MTIPVLEPCPFCGSDARLEHGDDPHASEYWFVECLSCAASAIAKDTGQDAVAAWNRRNPAVPADQRPARSAREVTQASEMVFAVLHNLLHGAPPTRREVALADAMVELVGKHPDSEGKPCDCGHPWRHSPKETPPSDRAARPPRDGDVHICDRRGCEGAAEHRAAAPPPEKETPR